MALDIGVFLDTIKNLFKSKVSSNDTQPDYLINKFTSSDASVTITETNDGGVEQINLQSAGGSDTNFATDDLILTGNRTHNLNGNDLLFTVDDTDTTPLSPSTQSFCFNLRNTNVTSGNYVGVSFKDSSNVSQFNHYLKNDANPGLFTSYRIGAGNYDVAYGWQNGLFSVQNRNSASTSGQNTLSVIANHSSVNVGSGGQITFNDVSGPQSAFIRSYTFGAAATGLAFGTGWSGSSTRMVIDENGSVGIGSTNPNSSAILEISSTNKGVLIPRMTATEAGAITGVNGLFLYVTSTDATFTSVGFWGYEAGAWVKL